MARNIRVEQSKNKSEDRSFYWFAVFNRAIVDLVLVKYPCLHGDGITEVDGVNLVNHG